MQGAAQEGQLSQAWHLRSSASLNLFALACFAASALATLSDLGLPLLGNVSLGIPAAGGLVALSVAQGLVAEKAFDGHVGFAEDQAPQGIPQVWQIPCQPLALLSWPTGVNAR